MHKFLFLALIGVIYLFQNQLHHGRNGQEDLAKIKTSINQQATLDNDLRDRNDMMEMKIAGLKGSTDSLEARSRNELNLIKPGETLVLLPGNDVTTDEKPKPKKSKN